MLRRFLALIALGAFLVPMVLPNRTQAARVQQDAKQDKKDAKQENKETPPPVRQDSNNKDTRFTAEQIVESVILIYGSRPLLEQIRRNGVERGKMTRYPAEGNPEETDYERRFVRGEKAAPLMMPHNFPSSNTSEYSIVGSF